MTFSRGFTEDINDKERREECIAFGEWLMAQGLIPVDDDVWKESVGHEGNLWDTKEGDWMSMEGLYNKFLAERQKPTTKQTTQDTE